MACLSVRCPATAAVNHSPPIGGHSERRFSHRSATFFPERAVGPNVPKSSKRAKAVCARCPVRPQCLDYALIANEAGVWGGMSEDERRQRRRELGLKSAPKHGCARRYAKGCRCLDCVEAHQAELRRRDERRADPQAVAGGWLAEHPLGR